MLIYRRINNIRKNAQNQRAKRIFLILVDLEAILRTDLAEELQESRMRATQVDLQKNSQNQRAKGKISEFSQFPI